MTTAPLDIRLITRGLRSRLVQVPLIALFLAMSILVVYTSAADLDHREPIAPVASPNGLDPAKVWLGALLFSDPILSGKENLSCTSCHDLDAGGTIANPPPVGYQDRISLFSTPTIFNVANNYRFGWRGEFTSLEAQNEKILLDANIMGATWPLLLSRLQSNRFYSSEFKRIYDRQIERTDLLETLAAFQRSLSTPNSAFDRYLQGEVNALTALEMEGYRLFKDYGCASCHQGSNIGGNMYQKFGIFAPAVLTKPVENGDPGRVTITGHPAGNGVFRVPSLRNVAVTAPYLHDGSVASLPLTVSIMAKNQLGRALARHEINALVAFLKTLTGEYNGYKLKATPPTTQSN